MAGGLYSATHFLGSTLVQLYLKAFLWWSHSMPQCATGAAEATCPQRTFVSAFQEGGTKAVTAHSAWRSLEMCDICFVMKQFLRLWSWKLETWFSFHPSASLGEEAGELGFCSSSHEVDGTSLSVVIIFTLNWRRKKKTGEMQNRKAVALLKKNGALVEDLEFKWLTLNGQSVYLDRVKM